VASPKVEEIFSQEIESLHSLRINPKHSVHNHMLNADYTGQHMLVPQMLDLFLGIFDLLIPKIAPVFPYQL
jgi:hypothetical protein